MSLKRTNGVGMSDVDSLSSATGVGKAGAEGSLGGAGASVATVTTLHGDDDHPASDAAPATLDFENDYLPFGIVWCPIPIITWLFPFIGHMGICSSEGVIFDFAGPYTIGVHNFAFGRPTRYMILDPKKVQGTRAGERQEDAWDRSVEVGCRVYRRRMHNLFCDNCHSHVARCLNEMKYDGKTDWTMVDLAARMLFRGHFVSFGAFLSTWTPFLVLVGIIVALKYLV